MVWIDCCMKSICELLDYSDSISTDAYQLYINVFILLRLTVGRKLHLIAGNRCRQDRKTDDELFNCVFHIAELLTFQQ